MKNFTRFLLAAMLSLGWLPTMAQQWSDVGNQGFTPTPFGTVDNQPDMVLSGNTPYMAYITNSGQVMVMKYAAGTWTALPMVATSGQTPDLAFDNSGTLYIVYQASGASNVKKFDGTNWLLVGSAAINNSLGISGGFTPRIAFDPVNNTPYIIFVDATNSVNAAKFNGTAWVVVGQADFHSGTFPRLAISSTGVPYVVSRSNLGNISVSKFDGSNWVLVGPAEFAGVAYFYSDIAIDATGAPYVVSTQFITTYKSTVLKFNGSAWVNVGAAGFTPGDVRYAQIKFNSAGVLHLVYTNAANGTRANLMKFDGANWVAVGATNFSSGSVNTPSLGFDTSDTPFVGFGDGSFTNAGTVMKLCSSSAGSITSTGPGSVCTSGAVTLSASGNATLLKWYNPAGGQVGTGSSYVTPSLSSTATYTVAAYDGNGCSSARSNVVATVSAVPTVVSSAGGGVCAGTAAQVSATVSAGTVSWFSAPTGGAPLATGIISGSLFTTPVVNISTTFYAEAVNNGCVSSARTAVTPVFHTVPANPVSLDGNRCGPGAVSVSVTAEPGTVQWFSAAVGGTLLQPSGSTFTTPSISANTTYYANVTSNVGCVSVGRTPVLAMIFGFPTITSSLPANRCGDGSVSLTVATSGDASAQWFTTPTGGTTISTLKTFVTPSLTATTTYYAEALESGCTSTSRTAVIATIKPIPTVTSSNVSRCDAGTVTFEATSAGTISWFGAASGGSVLGNGSNYTTPSLSVTTPYFAEAVLNGCTTPTRTQVSAIVNPTPAQPTISANNTNIDAPVLTSSSSTGNQWFRNNAAISGATNNTYTIADDGTYKVQVTALGCSSPFSTNMVYLVTGVELPTKESVGIYPNPTTEEIVLTLTGFTVQLPVAISVYDLQGRAMHQASAEGGQEVRLNVRSYGEGQYLIRLQQGKNFVSKSFIKTR